MPTTPATAAVLVKASGQVYVERNGTRTALSEGEGVFSTDTVITDGSSTAEIRFADGAMATLSPGTTLELTSFSFGGGQDPSFILNLAQGTMRSISGEVVKQNPDAFKIVTPQATVGIRGTELFNSVQGNEEVHAVLHISNGHIVLVTGADGKSITLNAALQAVSLSPATQGQMVMRTFTPQELDSLVETLAPSLLKNGLPAVEGQQENKEAQSQNSQESEGASPSGSMSKVVLIIEGDTSQGAEGVVVDTLIATLDHLQGALVDAGFEVVTVRPGEEISQEGTVSLPSPFLPPVQEAGHEEAVPTPPPTPPTPPVPPVPPGPSAVYEINASEVPSWALSHLQEHGQDVNFKLTVHGDVNGAGDVAMNASSVSGGVMGNDTVLINGNVSNTNIYGDAVAASDGSANVRAVGQGPLIFGNDILEIKGSLLAGGVIYGDGKSGSFANASAVVLGNDTIYVRGDVQDGSIYGDMQSGAEQAQGGDDVISVDGDVGNALLDAGVGNNSIVVGGLLATSTVQAGAGSDTLTVGGQVTNSTVNLGDGNNTLQAGAVSNSTLEGGSGNDAFTTGAVNTSSIKVGEGDNSIHSGALTDATLEGGTGRDGFTVTGDVNSGTINVGDGANTVSVSGALNGSTLLGGAGSDEFAITGTVSGSTIKVGDGNNTLQTGAVSNSTLEGGSGNDAFTTGAVNTSTIKVGEGDNSIHSGALTDVTLEGGAGRDGFTVTGDVNSGTINVGDGANTVSVSGALNGSTLLGGAGSDEFAITGTVSGSTIKVGDGNNTLQAGAVSNSTLEGGSGNDAFTTGAVNTSSIKVGEGDNSIHSGTLTDTTLEGGTGRDGFTVTGDVNSGTINVGDGANTVSVRGALNGATLLGGAGSDEFAITGTVSGSTIKVGDGNNTLQTGAVSNSTLEGGSGNDAFTTGAVNTSTIKVGEGDNSIHSGALTDVTLEGGAGRDGFTVTGDVNSGTINVGDGANTVSVSGALNGSTLLGGAGSDEFAITGTVSGSTIKVGDGNNTLQAGAVSNSTLEGGSGNDVFSTGAVNTSTIKVGEGDNSIHSGALTDVTLEGGAGRDEFTITGTVSGSTITTGGGNNTLQAGAVSGSTLEGGSGNDAFTTGAVSNSSIKVGDGDNSIHSGALTNATLEGGAGRDEFTITGNVQASTLEGGAGRDEFTITGTVSGSTITTGGGNNTLQAGAVSGSTLEGGSGNDAFTTGAVSNSSIKVGDGDNSIHSGALTDVTLEGGAGRDEFTITGNVSGSTITGGDGANTVSVSGALNGSTLIGGAGNDSFNLGRYESGDVVTGGGSDTVSIGMLAGDYTSQSGGGDVVIVNGVDTSLANAPKVVLAQGDTLKLGASLRGSIVVNMASGNAPCTIVREAGSLAGNGDTLIIEDFMQGSNALNLNMAAADRGTVGVNGEGDCTLTYVLGGSTFVVVFKNITPVNMPWGNIDNQGILISYFDLGDPVTSSFTGLDINDEITGGIMQNAITVSGGAGNDTISIKGVTSGSVQTIDGGTGNDSITLGQSTADVHDGVLITGGLGEDVIAVKGMLGNGTVEGGAGADTISVTTLSNNASVDGGAENDIINIGTMKGGVSVAPVVNGGDGNDTINIDRFEGGKVNGGLGNDVVNITTLAGEYTSASTSGDHIIVKAVDTSGSAPAVIMGEGDTVTLASGVQGSIEVNMYGNNGDCTLVREAGSLAGNGDALSLLRFESGNNTLNLNMGAADRGIVSMSGGNCALTYTVGGNTFTVNFDTLSVATLNTLWGNILNRGQLTGSFDLGTTVTENFGGTLFDDDIKAGELQGWNSIAGGEGNDTISIKGVASGSEQTIDGGTGNDSITLGQSTTDVHDGVLIKGAEGDDAITVKGMLDNGTVEGGVGVDAISVTTLGNNASVDGGAGNDVITIGTMKGGVSVAPVVNGGDGKDAINIDLFEGGNVDGGVGDDIITIGTMKGGVGVAPVVNGGDGNDIINIDRFEGGRVNGGLGNDVVNITTLAGEYTSASTSGDHIIVKTVDATGDDAPAVIMGAGDTVTLASGVQGYIEVNMNGNNGVCTLVREAGSLAGDGDTLSLLGFENGNNTLNLNMGATDRGIVSMAEGNSTLTYTVGGNTFTVNFGSLSIATLNTLWGNILNRGQLTGSFNLGDTVTENFAGTLFDDDIKAGELQGGNTIEGGEGNDAISIKSVESTTNQTIDGGKGDDSITLGDTLSPGAIHEDVNILGGEGNDTIRVIGELKEPTNFGGIQGGTGKDSINVDTLNGGSLLATDGTYASDGEVDSIHVGTMKAGSIDGDGDKDIISIGSLEGGTVNGGAGADEITITTMSGGELTGDADDIVNIGTVTGGTYSSGTIIIATLAGHFEGTKSADSNITIKALGANAAITLGTGDVLTLGTTASGTLTVNMENDRAGLLVVREEGALQNVNLIVNGFWLSGWGHQLDLNMGTTDVGILRQVGGDLTLSYTQGGTTFTVTLTGISVSEMEDRWVDISDAGLVKGEFALGTLANSFKATRFGDTITADLMNNAYSEISANAGADNIYVKQLTDGNIYSNTKESTSDGAKDTIKIDTMSGGSIIGDADADIIEVGELQNGTVKGMAGNDTITIEQMTDGQINGGDGDDHITITNTMSGGQLNGGDGNDSIVIGGLSAGGIVTGGAGKDTIKVTGALSGDIHAGDVGDGSDTSGSEISVGSLVNGGSITGDSGVDLITVMGTMSGGTISGGAGNDIITIGKYTAGTVDGGAGDDSIIITQLAGNYISSSSSGDNITVTNADTAGRQITLAAGDQLTLQASLDKNISVNMLSGSACTVVREASSLTANNTLTIANYDSALHVVNLGISDGTTRGILSTVGNDYVISYNLGGKLFNLVLTDGVTNNVDLSTLVDAGSIGADFALTTGVEIINGTVMDDNVSGDLLAGGTINTNDGHDTITITNMTAGTIDAGAGIDTISVSDVASGGIISAGAGTDSVVVGSLASGAVINGNQGSDVIRVTGSMSGSIYADVAAGTDASGGEIVVISMIGGAIIGDAGQDYVTIVESMSGGNINTGAGNDMVSVGSMSGASSITTDAGDDRLTVANFSGGQISLGAGADSSTVAVTGGTSGVIDLGPVDGEVDRLDLKHVLSENTTVTIGSMGSEDKVNLNLTGVTGIAGKDNNNNLQLTYTNVDGDKNYTVIFEGIEVSGSDTALDVYNSIASQLQNSGTITL